MSIMDPSETLGFAFLRVKLFGIYGAVTGSFRHELVARLVRGSSWVMIGNLGSQALTLFTSVALANILQPMAFGKYALLVNTFGFISTVLGLGLGQAGTKYVSELRYNDPSLLCIFLAQIRIASLVISVFGVLCLWAFSDVIAVAVFSQPDLTASIKGGCVFVGLSSFTASQMGILAGFESFRSIAAILMIRSILNFALVFALTPFGGVLGALWAAASSLLVGAVISEAKIQRLCINRTRRLSASDAPWVRARIWHYSCPALLAGAITSMAGLLSLRLVAVSTGGVSEVAVFNAANQWRVALLFVPSMVGQVILPILSSLKGPASQSTKVQLLKTAVVANALGALGLFLVMLLFSGSILRAYGKGFEGRQDVMVPLLLSAVLLSAQTPVGNYIAASGKMWVGFIHNFAWGASLVLCTAHLVDLGWGARALATAYLISYALHGMWTGAYAISQLRRD
jgi:O-antigen/teichoic acid export membrane protein